MESAYFFVGKVVFGNDFTTPFRPQETHVVPLLDRLSIIAHIQQFIAGDVFLVAVKIISSVACLLAMVNGRRPKYKMCYIFLQSSKSKIHII